MTTATTVRETIEEVSAAAEAGTLHAAQVPEIVIVVRRDDPVECQRHKIRMEKTSVSSQALAVIPHNGANMTGALGLAYCEACDDTYPWAYRVDAP